MSTASESDASSSSEDISTTGLIATRKKRVTAGNLYAALRANLDDEELQRDLLAEDEGDAGDYEGSDKGHGDDDDDALDSSSDDEDAGPPKEGDAEDLEGEKALKKQERAEARKKRKVHEARLKLPAWRKKKEKRVKLADDVKTEDGNTSERPRKKSERSNWLPSAADAPTRQSARSLAVANREIVHANLKQSAARSEKQRRVMKDAADREKTKRRMDDMSQEERLSRCEIIERETAQELGRWERDEAERQRLREEALAAKRKRGFDGPYTRYWSGSVLWVGDKVRVRRLSHGSRVVDEIKLPGENEDKDKSSNSVPSIAVAQGIYPSMAAHTMPYLPPDHEPAPIQIIEPQQTLPPPSIPTEVPASTETTWLPGIQEYAAQQEPGPLVSQSSTPTLNNYIPSAPSINQPASSEAPPLVQTHVPPPPQPQIYHGWPPGTHQFPVRPIATQPAPVPAPPPPPAPLIREQAQRSLLILEQFAQLNGPTTTSKRSRANAKDTSTLEADALKSLLLPGAHPAFTPEESKYLLAKHRKKANELHLAAPPPRARCALTSWPAKFRDPKTDLAYADMHQYKAIQRLLAGGCQWSRLLGCWVGPTYGKMGRPAKGTPDGFAGFTVTKTEETT